MVDAVAPGSPSGTRDRIVSVAARLLQEQGAAAVTTRGVAQLAGVQAPAIYRLFGAKDGLLEAVAEHVMSTQVSAKAAALEAAAAGDVDAVDELRDGWMTQIEFGVTNPALFALLSDPGRVQRSPAAQAGRRVLESRVHRVAAAGRLRVSERRAVDLISAAGIGTVVRTLATPPEQRDPELARSMYDTVTRGILTDPPASTAGGPVETAVALRAAAASLGMLSDAERRLLAEWLDRAIDALQSATESRPTP